MEVKEWKRELKKAEKMGPKEGGKISVWVDAHTSTEEVGSYVLFYTLTT